MRIFQVTSPLLLLAFLFNSCVSYPELVNFSRPPELPDTPQVISNRRPITIKPNDILQVQVSSTEPMSIRPFVAVQGSGETSSAEATYLVNSSGRIVFPTLGRIAVEGLELEAAADTLLSLLSPYFEEPPIVNVRLANFRVNVNGEVNNPGIFTIPNERVTILDAITLAGDFTSYSRRDSILIIREDTGVRTFNYIDLNSANAFTSPYFYLQQNDVVYVKPSKNKTNAIRDPANRYLPWISAVASLAAIIVSISRIR